MATTSVQRIELSEVESDSSINPKPLVERDLSLIRDVAVELSAVIGEVHLSVEELFSLKGGAVLKLKQGVDEPITFYLEGKAVARGQLVAVDDCFGVRITDVL